MRKAPLIFINVMTRLKKFLLLLWAGVMLTACVPPSRLILTVEPSPTAPAQASAAPSPTAQPAAPEPTPQGAWIRPQPESGAPGASVQIEGFLPGGLAQETLEQADYTTHASLCWDGCQTGLLQDGLEVHWSRTDPGRFEMQFTVPSAPWLASDGIHLLEAGDYSLELIHLDPANYGCKSPDGCEVVPAASARFHLSQSAPRADCTASQCGALIPSLSQAGPGEQVQVQGWAPLLKIIGDPVGYNLVLVSNDAKQAGQIMGSFPVQQALDGSISGAFQVPLIGYYGTPLEAGAYTLALDAGSLRTVKNSPPVLVNATPFQISAAPAWTDQDHPQPVWIQPSADLTESSLATDPLNPARMAYCAPGRVLLTEDGGKTWLTFPTTDVAQLPLDSAVTLDGNQKLPLCSSVTLDSAHPDSLYITFALVNEAYGPPPVYSAGYFTSDRGETWQAAPVPSVKRVDTQIVGLFGGFSVNGQRVQALFYQTSENEYTPGVVQAKETTDGGVSWHAAPLACPTSGPCLRWGGAPAMSGGMGAEIPQRVLASADGGQSWQETGQSAELRQEGPHALAALSDQAAVLLSGTASFPLRYTADGGQTWQMLSLPELPLGTSAISTEARADGIGAGFRGLQMLPDGRLLAMRSDPDQWMALMPGAKAWCQVHFTSASAAPLLFHVVGNQVWWLDNVFIQAKSGPLNQFDCK